MLCAKKHIMRNCKENIKYLRSTDEKGQGRKEIGRGGSRSAKGVNKRRKSKNKTATNFTLTNF